MLNLKFDNKDLTDKLVRRLKNINRPEGHEKSYFNRISKIVSHRGNIPPSNDLTGGSNPKNIVSKVAPTSHTPIIIAACASVGAVKDSGAQEVNIIIVNQHVVLMPTRLLSWTLKSMVGPSESSNVQMQILMVQLRSSWLVTKIAIVLLLFD